MMKFPSETPHTKFPESHSVHFSADGISIFFCGAEGELSELAAAPRDHLPTLEFHRMLYLRPLFSHCLQSRHFFFVDGCHDLLKPL
jgi:hypothetical protein